MKGTLVFDHLNDLIYLNCSPRFVRHVKKLASSQGLVSSEYCQPFGKGKMALDPNVIIQLFSPLVTSQRFMREQFGNPYTSLLCEDGTNIVFQDFMGFLFLRIGTEEEISGLKRSIGITITLVTYLCGPDVALLKSSPFHSKLLDDLLASWNFLVNSDQAFLIEGINQIKVNSQLNSSLVNSLAGVAGKVQSQLGNNLHTLLFLETKLLSWYSSKNAVNLGPEDLLFLIALCHKTKHGKRKEPLKGTRSLSRERGSGRTKGGFDSGTEDDSSVEFHSTKGDSDQSCTSTTTEDEEQEDGDDDWKFTFIEGDDTDDESIVKYAILLKDDQNNFIPHIAHVGIVQDGLYFVLLSQPPTAQLTTIAISAFQQAIEFHIKSRDPISDKSHFEHLESTTKKLGDLLKKHKNFNLKNELGSRWDRFKTGFQLYLKTKETISVQCKPMVDIFREIFRTYFNNAKQFLSPSPIENKSFLGSISGGTKIQALDTVWNHIRSDTEDFWGFIRLKADFQAKSEESGSTSSPSSKTNLLMESRENLSINKYLEEFPGLVHFIYIDRNKHSVILPTLNYAKEETVKLTKSKIWGMVNFARNHMQYGHFSIMWKDSAFNYAYFMWFEDSSGTAIRPKQPAMPMESCFPLPGIMSGDFYKQVLLECFPNVPLSKIRCVELFCIHLGLVTSGLVIDHAKRLSVNIFDEFTGGNAAMDLL